MGICVSNPHHRKPLLLEGRDFVVELSLWSFEVQRRKWLLMLGRVGRSLLPLLRLHLRIRWLLTSSSSSSPTDN